MKKSYLSAAHGAIRIVYDRKGRERWVASLFMSRGEYDAAPGKEHTEVIKAGETWYIKQLTSSIELICTEPPTEAK